MQTGKLDVEGNSNIHEFFSATKSLYEEWVSAATKHLESAEKFVKKGYIVEGIEEFRSTLDKERCLVGNLQLESEMPTCSELAAYTKIENPNPDRYGK